MSNIYRFDAKTPVSIVSKTGFINAYLGMELNNINFDITTKTFTITYLFMKKNDSGAIFENYVDSDIITYIDNLDSEVNILKYIEDYLNSISFYTLSDWKLSVISEGV